GRELVGERDAQRFLGKGRIAEAADRAEDDLPVAAILLGARRRVQPVEEGAIAFLRRDVQRRRRQLWIDGAVVRKPRVRHAARLGLDGRIVARVPEHLEKSGAQQLRLVWLALATLPAQRAGPGPVHVAD